MKKYLFIIVALCLFTRTVVGQQRVIAECTVTYNIVADSTVDKETKETLEKTTKTVYIKGNTCRTNLLNSAFSQAIIYEKLSGTATILREIGSNKFITKLDKTQWIEKHKQFEGMQITKLNEVKNILGYPCKKIIMQLKDSSIYHIYYATSIVPSVKEFEFQFKEVPGFVLEYEINEIGAKKIQYVATKINLNPVANTIFAIPTVGYRILTEK